MFSISWSFAFLPAIRVAGSPPGTTMKITKTRKLTATSTRIIPTTRLAMNVSTSVLHPDLRTRVESVAKAVAEDVERDRGQDDGDARHERQPRRRRDARLTVG